ncbi:predicted protein [Botrytis cinerea T4]|uniref:Uncharacterized protein n=1 Tax=Botryotinia fuckeliana (strain T4) TaxID=999810 RepID=G2YY93_BOTF4|nr:predicted protein [Botrytis cinerea T4]
MGKFTAFVLNEFAFEASDTEEPLERYRKKASPWNDRNACDRSGKDFHSGSELRILLAFEAIKVEVEIDTPMSWPLVAKFYREYRCDHFLRK